MGTRHDNQRLGHNGLLLHQRVRGGRQSRVCSTAGCVHRHPGRCHDVRLGPDRHRCGSCRDAGCGRGWCAGGRVQAQQVRGHPRPSGVRGWHDECTGRSDARHGAAGLLPATAAHRPGQEWDEEDAVDAGVTHVPVDGRGRPGRHVQAGVLHGAVESHGGAAQGPGADARDAADQGPVHEAVPGGALVRRAHRGAGQVPRLRVRAGPDRRGGHARGPEQRGLQAGPRDASADEGLRHAERGVAVRHGEDDRAGVQLRGGQQLRLYATCGERRVPAARQAGTARCAANDDQHPGPHVGVEARGGSVPEAVAVPVGDHAAGGAGQPQDGLWRHPLLHRRLAVDRGQEMHRLVPARRVDQGHLGARVHCGSRLRWVARGCSCAGRSGRHGEAGGEADGWMDGRRRSGGHRQDHGVQHLRAAERHLRQDRAPQVPERAGRPSRDSRQGKVCVLQPGRVRRRR
mmetsp:Transcript_22079/g.71068  ORF Transcript_22079/g.71068 Transcript_22079/m.71068 type:complete len:458 (+) Transcript_22079:1613-2986(+)